MPSFYVDNEIFWGQDSEELLVSYIENSQNTKQSTLIQLINFLKAKLIEENKIG